MLASFTNSNAGPAVDFAEVRREEKVGEGGNPREGSS
jgi:hypothetical protein